MAKIITVTIDKSTGDTSIELIGFKGKGCAAVLEGMRGRGKFSKTVDKPEYNQANINTQTK